MYLQKCTVHTVPSFDNAMLLSNEMSRNNERKTGHINYRILFHNFLNAGDFFKHGIHL